jgi:hypothetical protein
MENQLTAHHYSAAQAQGLSLRTNLVRFGITAKVPPTISALIIDVFDILPDPNARAFMQKLLSLRGDTDNSRLPALFAHWLLLDPVHGAIHLSKRDDVKDTIQRVADQVLSSAAKGLSVDILLIKKTLFMAQINQVKTWHAYEFGHTTAGLQPRIEWMISTAATDAMLPTRPEQLVGAVHSCAVAKAAATQSEQLALPSVAFYQAIADKLSELLQQSPAASEPPAVNEAAAPIPAPVDTLEAFQNVFAPGVRVSFDDPHEGPQTGTISGVLDTSGTVPSAVINVDHNMDGITWNVPLARLTPLPQAAA